MKYEIQKVMFDFVARENASRPFLAGCIPGAAPYHHTGLKGSSLTLAPEKGHHVLIVLKGEVTFATDGNEYTFHERVVFVPSPEKPVEIRALTDLQILEIRWFKREGEDDRLAAEYHFHLCILRYIDNALLQLLCIFFLHIDRKSVV